MSRLRSLNSRSLYKRIFRAHRNLFALVFVKDEMTVMPEQYGSTEPSLEGSSVDLGARCAGREWPLWQIAAAGVLCCRQTAFRPLVKVTTGPTCSALAVGRASCGARRAFWRLRRGLGAEQCSCSVGATQSGRIGTKRSCGGTKSKSEELGQHLSRFRPSGPIQE